jgi:hypothetical protein
MPTETELNAEINKQIALTAGILRKILGRFNPTATNADNNAISYFIRALGEVRHTLDPDMRVQKYEALFKELFDNPSKFGLLGFYISPYNSGFYFTEHEKAEFSPMISAFKQAQSELNSLILKAHTDTRHAPMTISKPNEHPDHKEVRVNLEAQIQQLKSLRDGMKSNAIKSIYKNVKKKILEQSDIKHHSKAEMLDVMIADLQAIAEDAEIKRLSPESTAANVNAKIFKVIQAFEEKRKDRSQPLLMRSRETIQPLPDEIAKHANNAIWRESDEANNLFAIINALKDNSKYRNKAISKTLSREAKMGDLLRA